MAADGTRGERARASKALNWRRSKRGCAAGASGSFRCGGMRACGITSSRTAFISASNRKDNPGALACLTHDAIYQDVTYGTHSGQNELKKMFERMFHEADASWKVRALVADAERVAIEWTVESQITAAVPQSAGKQVRLF